MKRLIVASALVFTVILCGYAEEIPEVKELFSAIEKNDIQKVQVILGNPNLANMPNGKGIPPLIYAAMKDNTQIGELLVSRGADVNKGDSNGITPLMWAAAKGNEKLVRLFIIRGASISQKDTDGKNALQWAYFKGNPKVIKFLKDLGAREEDELLNADPNSIDNKTPGIPLVPAR